MGWRARQVLVLLCAVCCATTALAQTRVNVIKNDPALSWPGLQTEVRGIFAAGGGGSPRVREFENSGAVLASWRAVWPGWQYGSHFKPLPGGGFLGVVRSSDGQYQLIVELDWSGAARWLYYGGGQGLTPHHDFQRLANGNTLILAKRTRTAPAIKAGPVVDDVVIEVARSGAVVWEWSTVDHASQLPLSTAEWNYIATLPQSVIFHTNSIQALPPNQWEATDPRFRAGNIMVSQRDTNAVFLIDKQTKNVVWSYKGAIGQHHVRMIPNYLPGAGNVLLYDNGGSGGAPPITRNYSRIIELDPTTMQEVWSYECRPPGSCSVSPRINSFYAPFMGGAQRLPNGNTLISDLRNARVFEITSSGVLAWEYLMEPGEQVYRAYRMDFAWWVYGGPEFPW